MSDQVHVFYGITLVKTAHGFGSAEKDTTVRAVFRTGYERDEAIRRAYRILQRDHPSENPMAWSPTDEQFASECVGDDDCKAAHHIHGCFADRGNCDHPSEHPRQGLE